MALQTAAPSVRIALDALSVGLGPNGEWQLQGTLRNDAAFAIAYPRVVVTLRRAQGEFLAAAVAYASTDRLEVGQTAPFAVSIPLDQVTGWAGYAAIGTGERR